ncbi:hypothetical protein [Chitinophaga pinensis]|uniref:Uncharacterized protein n=1 Tax=Chitinophaga pinensis (strain ATCC 43595 / DSM 2588 / LMG 13176 / NBRC 15968 / NCIMB 11800 / UQM 2034) TaxID=485918 RepID=A0A979G4G3_CHIPD|nr:hypothetical protein [Chitinophaga pinensis]ACU60647.1 hypothetical protein Cpin_3180 [Chitinophaga pinensis DSM 2588]
MTTQLKQGPSRLKTTAATLEMRRFSMLRAGMSPFKPVFSFRLCTQRDQLQAHFYEQYQGQLVRLQTTLANDLPQADKQAAWSFHFDDNRPRLLEIGGQTVVLAIDQPKPTINISIDEMTVQ